MEAIRALPMGKQVEVRAVAISACSIETMAARSVDEYFQGKPESYRIFRVVADRIAAQGPSDLTIGSQISFGRTRRFVWFWLYNVTRKNPDGIPHLMLALDHEAKGDMVRDVTRVGKNRWNHQVVVKSVEDARSPGLADLIQAAYEYGGAERPRRTQSTRDS